MKSHNKYDVLIEKLATEFSRIKNFHLMQEDDKGKIIFTFLIKRLAEIHAFKTLFTHYYLPAASKSVADDLKELNKSKYKYFIHITTEELKENYYETIRLAYIGMFHKYENYLDDLLIHAEMLISDLTTSEVSLVKYVEQQFNYKIKDWKISSTISRLNWIAICNKHYNGYPRKKPKHPRYTHLPDDEKMRFTKDDFIKDIDLLITHFTFSLQCIFSFAMHKMAFENMIFEMSEFKDVELNQKLIDSKYQMNEHIIKLIELQAKI